MARVSPFRALRFDPDSCDPAAVVAPASQRIDLDTRKELEAREPRNVVRVVADPIGAEPAALVARRAAFHLAEWRRAGVLALDDYPAFYALRQTVPGDDGGEASVVEGFYGAVSLDEESRARVLSFEARDEALIDAAAHRLTEARHQVEPVTLVYRDEKRRVSRAIQSEMEERDPDVRIEHEGAVYELWAVEEETTTARVSALLEDKDLYVLAGHKRFFAAVAVEDAMSKRGGDDRAPTSAVALLCDVESAAPRVQPLHRAASWMGTRDLSQILGELQRWFRRTEVEPGDALREAVTNSSARVAFGLALRDEGAWLCELLEELEPSELPGLDGQDTSVETVVVDEVVLAQLFGVDPQLGDVRHVRDADILPLMLAGDDFDVALLVRAPPLDTLIDAAERRAALAPGAMVLEPEPPTGLVFSPLVARTEEDE